MSFILLIFICIIDYINGYNNCSLYINEGCASCVANLDTLTSGCVWCGLIGENQYTGGCYDYSVISLGCKTLIPNQLQQSQLDLDLQQYGCCSQQFRIGSNAKVTCNANFTNIVISETQKREMIFGIYFWAIGFIATLFVYNKIGYSGCVSLFNAIFFPLLAIAIFFIDT